MSSRRLAKISLAKISLVAAIVLMVVSVAGFTVGLMLNIFLLDKYNAYGEVPIPGSGSLHLPAGEVTVSFHSEVIGSPSGGGLPVPQFRMSIEPPARVPKPVITESYGSATTINNDAHVRLWVVQVPAEATYNIKTEGQVGGYISPRLAFGHKGAYGSMMWVFVGLFGMSLLALICTLWWSARTRSSKRRVVTAEQPVSSYTALDAEVSVAAPERSPSPHTPNDMGIKLEQLKMLASLRDFGALTEAEFETEKRKILDGT
jgi:hypothetical protein